MTPQPRPTSIRPPNPSPGHSSAISDAGPTAQPALSVDRSLIAAMVLAALRIPGARKADLYASHLVLHRPSGLFRTPIETIREIQLSSRYAWADVTILHDTHRDSVSGLNRSDARILADTLDRARMQWWHREIAQLSGDIDALYRRLAAFPKPDHYITADELAELARDAHSLTDPYPPNWPASLANLPSFRKLRDIRTFLETPDLFREKANEIFIADELAAGKELFDTVEPRPLTDEQRRAVVVDGRRNLVLAPAGSGKTSVIVAKTAWLLQRRNLRPPEILLLAFAKDARKEMHDRIRARLGPAAAGTLAVRTFHSLGLAIITDAEGEQPKLSPLSNNDRALSTLVREILADQFTDPDLSPVILDWFQNRFAPYRPVHEFNSWHDYWHYLRRHEIRSLRGDRVNSFEQAEIANFLYINGVQYEYDALYEHDTEQHRTLQYRPHFLLTDHGIYIEHFMLDAAGETPPFIDRDSYHNTIHRTRTRHRRHGTTLIEIYTHQSSGGALAETLGHALKSHDVPLTPIAREELFAALDAQGRISPLIDLLTTFLRHYKGARMTRHELADRADRAPDADRARCFAALFHPILERYASTLSDAGEIDFHDMVNAAADHISDGRSATPYRYILVDEFQDISHARRRLLEALLDQPPYPQLFAVGDDWQAIFRFAGSDISIIRDFQDTFGETERIPLETTFRCTDRIAEAAARFILRNPQQIQRRVRSTRTADAPAIHVGLSNDQNGLLAEALDTIAADAADHDARSTVLLLARYRHELPDDPRSLSRAYPALRFLRHTVHGAKGLEADYVVVFGLRSGKFAFPTEIADDPLLDLVLATSEPHPNAEERRLFYVALTRARRQVHLLADARHPSPFVTELLDHDYDVVSFGDNLDERIPCPTCQQGHLERRSNRVKKAYFYACSNWPYCKHTQDACPACGEGLPLPQAGESICRDCGERLTPCTSCDGYMQPREGPRGVFFGCSNYPRCRYTENGDPHRQPSAGPSDPGSPPPTGSEPSRPIAQETRE